MRGPAPVTIRYECPFCGKGHPASACPTPRPLEPRKGAELDGPPPTKAQLKFLADLRREAGLQLGEPMPATKLLATREIRTRVNTARKRRKGGAV